MKKLLLLLLFTTVSQAQIVNIPDWHFTTKLIALGVDLNGDGQIQVSEAELITNLNLDSAQIQSLEGIKSFVNLSTLNCQFNNISTIDVSSLTNLTNLDCSRIGYLNSINVSGCTALTSIDVSHCNLGFLDLSLSGLTNLASLNCSYNENLLSLNVSGLTSLITLDSSYCSNLPSLNVSGLTSLTTLRCGWNEAMTTLNLAGCSALSQCYAFQCAITTLNASNLTALTELDLSGNQLNQLNVSSCTQLKTLSAINNHLTSIDISGCTKLHDLNLSYNQLTTMTASNLGLVTVMNSINVSNNLLTNLNLNNVRATALSCHHNQLSTLDLSSNRIRSIDASDNLLQSFTMPGSVSIIAMYLSNNQLTSLDLSTSRFSSSAVVTISNNPDLVSIFAKNGYNEHINPIGINPVFICDDESQLTTLQNNFPNTVVSSYCTFVPGGNYNTITGNITFDADNNGCDSTDPDQPYVKLNLTSGNNNYAVFTSPDGTYDNFGQTGTFNVSVAMENASLFTITPPLATIIFGNNNNNITTQDFCITANGIQNDLETVIVPIAPARPGFDATYQIIYKNKGNQVLSGSVDFTYPENELDFLNASVVPDAESSGALSWNFSNLYPFESRSIDVRLNVNSPMEAPAVNIGDQLSFEVQANPLAGDVTPGDNGFSIKQIVVGSFDPNDITCLEGEHVNPTEIGNYLHYNVNFENTGTAAAENIVVVDMIDLTKFDISSLQILNASHPMVPRITNDKVEFIFEGINLGASEHGNVTFKIKTKNTLVTGNSVSQKADIYFDYNFPVATNVAMTTFDTLGTANVVLDNDISIYPNPTKGLVNIKSDSEIKSVGLFDVQGRQLLMKSNVEALDISTYTSGVYFIKVATYKGFKTQKLIKQ